MRAEHILPYAKPWVMIDQIRELDCTEGTVSMKLISSSDFFLQGHFPAYSVYPGMLLVEGIRQTINCKLQHETDASKWKEHTIHSRFLQPVLPGDSVKYIVQRNQVDEHDAVFHGAGWVDEHKVIQVMIAYRKEGEENEANSRH